MNFNLRIIKYKKLSPFLNMAIDEFFLLNNDGKTIILRFFGWEPPSISIGTFQKISELEIDYIKENNIPFVRRPTGGKGVYHDDELTYSIIIPKTHPIYELDIIESYKLISEVFIKSLNDFNINGKLTKKSGEIDGFCFSSQNYYEISVNGKKIIGSAQRRKKEGILQQGSIPFSIDYEKVKKIFKLLDVSRFSSLKEIKHDLKITDLEDSLIENFINFFNVDYKIDNLNEEELNSVNYLVLNKYSLDSWNLKGLY
ncbi:MAG: lipoate--protein ligase family protein [Caldisericia bacterium]